MPPSDAQYTTKELSAETWTDFEALFAKHGGVQGGCWCVFYHRSRPVPDGERSGASRRERNRRDKETLVKDDRSHGILVYEGDRAVGWCQYGPQAELPRIDAGRNYRKLALPNQENLWRITCFFVDRDHRGRGIARIALRAALASIARQGGGVVEAYPVTHARAVAAWFGSVGMFEEEGFEPVDRLGRSNLLMRRTVP